jgi:hypothetical protein
MLTGRYMTSTKNISAIMKKVVEGTAPTKFTVAHLKSIGFKSSNDLGVIPLLKELAFLAPDGTPTPRYHAYRDSSNSRKVLGEALREAYEDVFHINERPTDADKTAIEGKFKSVHNVTDRVATEQTRTFFALLSLAELDSSPKTKETQQHDDQKELINEEKDAAAPNRKPEMPAPALGGLRYNIEIHLPATKDIEVFNAIFKALKEHLLD